MTGLLEPAAPGLYPPAAPDAAPPTPARWKPAGLLIPTPPEEYRLPQGRTTGLRLRPVGQPGTALPFEREAMAGLGAGERRPQ
ncbi:hypothetical protein HEK616_83790 (plasmid) [Streptomyces nigrescens]|uniref:Uncharacterized protein n=1 Tax=Streptomyces nigrescens TaxID=1920 RepID=A0ABM8A8N2_STRNI|nr:hypothetical protein HEK616_83570 [Streptomyces nigrescens]BDM74892.1 hypothetical protein HEK616_83790 [Streptomyces nigrescens]